MIHRAGKKENTETARVNVSTAVVGRRTGAGRRSGSNDNGDAFGFATQANKVIVLTVLKRIQPLGAYYIYVSALFLSVMRVRAWVHQTKTYTVHGESELK